MYAEKEPLTADKLDVVGEIVGFKFYPGGSPTGLVDIYIEDDELWHYKLTINQVWLEDLVNTAIKAEKAAGEWRVAHNL